MFYKNTINTCTVGSWSDITQFGKWRVCPDGELLKMFRRVLLNDAKTSKNMALVKLGYCVGLLCLYSGSISLTKPKSELQPYLPLQQDVLSES